MKPLQEEFEKQLQIKLEVDGSLRIGAEVVITPAAILLLDPTAYDAEYARWQDEWLESRSQRLAQILALTPDNEARYQDLMRGLSKRRLAAFVGAGMSMASGMKSWPGFLRDLRLDTGGSCRATALNRLLSGRYMDYEAAADLLYDHMEAALFQDRMRTRFQVSPDRIEGPVRLLPYLFQRWVFTTNYDNILEEVYSEAGLGFEQEQIFRGNQLLEDFQQHYDDTKPLLVKLHGDARYPSQRVFRRIEYEAAYAPDSYVRSELSRAAEQRMLLFIGCSLGADRTLGVLHETALANRGQPKHYAFLPLASTPRQRTQKENFLAARGIYPIWYDAPTPADHDDAIEALLVGMLRELKKL